MSALTPMHVSGFDHAAGFRPRARGRVVQKGGGVRLVSRTIEAPRNQHLAILKQRGGIVSEAGPRHAASRCPGARSLTEGRGGSGRHRSEGEQS
jgi:hypothetical protein